MITRDYSPHGISFNLIETTTTLNSTWAQHEDRSTMGMVLRKGGYDALNVYFLTRVVAGAAGFCPTPFKNNTKPGQSNFIRDGCVINSSTIPGGSSKEFNLGSTTTHEIGHWFNLHHPFDGYSCTGEGDLVDDTPPQKSSSEGCPIGKDSCPGGGLDSIHNFMEFTYDNCTNNFTPGQV